VGPTLGGPGNSIRKTLPLVVPYKVPCASRTNPPVGCRRRELDESGKHSRGSHAKERAEAKSTARSRSPVEVSVASQDQLLARVGPFVGSTIAGQFHQGREYSRGVTLKTVPKFEAPPVRVVP
jgi:hypothetical protein